MPKPPVEWSDVFRSLEATSSSSTVDLILQALQITRSNEERKVVSSREISAGAIVEEGDGLYKIDAVTDRGMEQFAGVRHTNDVQSETTWPTWRDEFDFTDNVAVVDESNDPGATVDSAIAILKELSQADDARKRELIINAEAFTFDGNARIELISILRDYIDQNRDSNDQDVLLAVGSAIRKYVAMIDMSDIDSLASILESGHRASTSIEIELEVAKMAFRKFVANPPRELNTHSALADQLADLARVYLNPRVFPKGRCSAVAMLATQASLVMISSHCEQIIAEVKNSPYQWFREQLRRRMDSVVRDQPQDAPFAQRLKCLVATITLASKGKDAVATPG